MQEHRTAGLAAARLRGRRLRRDRRASAAPASSGVLRNGDGPTVMLRADMDALPVTRGDRAALRQHRDRDRPRRPRDVPVMHACGHDMHVTWLAGATALLAALARRLARARCWRSSSPPRRPPQGAQAMIDDGLFDRFPKPEVILGQHVMPGASRRDRLPPRHHAGRRRQPRGPAVRPRRARLDARVERRSRS